jgi:ElaB/YqjD/DUF883 family membrane-anchored ribosome-binding protein
MEPENTSTAPIASSPTGGDGGVADSGGGPSPVLQFRERFESLLPGIQREWPEVARHTVEATRGSLDHAVEVISRQTGHASDVVRARLLDLVRATGDQAQQVGDTVAQQVSDTLRPLEEQLESLLDDLNTTLRPKIEKPVRDRPLLALGVAAGVGLLAGLLLASGRRSA